MCFSGFWCKGRGLQLLGFSLLGSCHGRKEGEYTRVLIYGFDVVFSSDGCIGLGDVFLFPTVVGLIVES